MTEEILADSLVTLRFRLTLEDGTLVDQTEDGDTLTVDMSSDEVLIDGLRHALLGLKAGDRETLVIPPESGFGFRDPEAVQQMPLADFPPGIKPKPGRIIGFTLPDGEMIPGAVLDIEGDQVTVDFNHPCAGHEVTFQVEILSVKNPG